MCSEEVLNGGTFSQEFLSGLLHAGLGDLVVKVETGNWGVGTILADAWEGEHETSWDTVELTVGLESN